MKTDYNVNGVKRDGRREGELRKLSLTCSSVGEQAMVTEEHSCSSVRGLWIMEKSEWARIATGSCRKG